MSSSSAATILGRFSEPTRAWFEGTFTEPTPAQLGAWDAISSGRHALVVAPTGSGKTLSAFLWAIDNLMTNPAPADPKARCRVLYISPMKALAVDVERNLRSPLVGVGHARERLGLPAADVSVAVRSGDTPAKDRAAFARRPSDILITTPESLFLLVTSNAREALAGVETVIVDEIHALAGSKRGSHLALSLERLDALLPRPAQRIGLSATVRPVDEVARFLAGGRPVDTVQPPIEKTWDLQVVVPVEDLGELYVPGVDASRPDDSSPQASIWPHVEEHVVDLIAQHRSTLVFVNSRRLAERLTARLNEVWEERNTDPSDDTPAAPLNGSSPAAPAQAMGAAGSSAGAAPVLARAHHGSVSREQRQQIEEDLKAGRLSAVVATSSLELGIDMGAVDLVIQVEAPPSVASGLQRVGRAGHQVGATSRGVFFPKYRGDLVMAAVVLQRMRAGQIESLAIPANPLDVLAQHIVAMCALDDWTVEELHDLVRRSAPYASLTRATLENVLDMLAGKYPSEDFAGLRARVSWDRITGTVSGRRGSQRIAVTSGGTIPDRGLFGVYLASGEGPGRRVGELDEEMVYESRVGDAFTLGTSTWRIEDITHDRVLVTPAPGMPGRLPFWHGDGPGRPAELGRALGQFQRTLAASNEADALEMARACDLDDLAARNLTAYIAQQQQATGRVPDDRTIVIERFRDEIGDWRIAIHSPWGARVNAPWALIIGASLQRRHGVDVQAMHADDGIVLRLPDMLLDGDAESLDLAQLVVVDPAEVTAAITDELGGSAMFASRFRECASRALLLPRNRPDRRQALWQQRQRAASLLQVASNYPDFPIVLETVRECLQDVFDVPALADLMRGIEQRRIDIIDVQTANPSPFARSLMFGYIAQYLYEGDSPLAEQRAAALSLDPTLLAELLGTGDGLALRDLLDPDAITTTAVELSLRSESRRCRDAEDVLDLLRTLGPLSTERIAESVRTDLVTDLPEWLETLRASRAIFDVQIAGEQRCAAIEDAARLRDGLGVQLPPGIPDTFLVGPPDPVADLVARYARSHTPFTAAECAQWWGFGVAVATSTLARLVDAGRVNRGAFLPPQLARGNDVEFCDAQVLRTIRRRSLAALRAEVEPVTNQDLARFLPAWQAVGSPRRGVESVLAAVEQLAGAVIPASAVESLILPARVRDYQPAMLDDVMAAGSVLWQGHGPLGAADGYVSLHVAETAALTVREPTEPPDENAALLLAQFDAAGGYRFSHLSEQARTAGATADLSQSLWSLVWAGRVTGDTFAPVRSLLETGRTRHRRASTPRAASVRRRTLTGLRAPTSASAPVTPTVAGRWSLVPTPSADATERAYAWAELLLDRYGVVTRGSVDAEDFPGGFSRLYRVFSAAEDAGRVRRGYFVEGLGAAQFATTGAVDRLRSAPRRDAGSISVLAATDPASPWGAALPWPQRSSPSTHGPARRAGAMTVAQDGQLLLFVERGGRSVLTWTDDPELLGGAASALAQLVRAGSLAALTIEQVDGEPVLGAKSTLVAALQAAGFHETPKGLRLRR